MATLNIANRNALNLPLDFVTERIAFLARTGAGKSGGMRVLAEEMLDAGQFIVFLDPKGDAWGIRSDYSVLIMGGEHADVPLEASGGKFVAEFLARERVPTVLDVSDFSKADLMRFTAAFGERFFRINRDVVHIFIDEVDMVAGQQFYDPHCLEAIQHLQTKGRQRGIGLTLATNRSQQVNKTVLDASGTLIAMQTTSPRGLAAVRDWLEAAADKETCQQILSQLPQLKTREAFVYSPQFLGPEPQRITFRQFRTFDSMATPKPGEVRRQPKSLRDIDLSSVKRDMAATLEAAKANDPAELKKQLAALQRQLREKPAAAVDENAVQRAVASAVAERDKHWQREVATIQKAHGSVVGKLQRSGALAQQIAALAELNGDASAVVTPPVKVVAAVQRPAPPVAVGDFTLSKVQKRIIDALAWYESLGNMQPSLTQVGAVALIDPTGGYFSNTVGPLSSAGLVDRDRGVLRLTDAGRAVAQPMEDAGTLAEYHDVLRHRVRKMKSASNKTIEVLNAVIEGGGESLTNEQVGEAVGIDHTGGYYSNTIGPLSTAGLIVRRGGVVTPTDVLFPNGLT